MMNVQGMNCQPIRPSYKLNSKPSFGNDYEDYAYKNEIDSLKKEQEDLVEMSKNKDNKLISSIGTLGMGAAAAAISFYTFKAFSPKAFSVVKKAVQTVANWGIVKKPAGWIKKGAAKLAQKISTAVKNINPESKMGKVKKFVSDKLASLKTKTSPIVAKAKEQFSNFVKKHNINKDFMKKSAINTGATLVAIPSAVTTVNDVMEGNNGGEA